MNKRGYVTLALVLVTALSFGLATVATAQLSVPGDTLYGLKSMSEEVYLSLAVTDTARAKAALSIAESKLSEIQELQENGAVPADFSQAEIQLATNLAIASSSIEQGLRSGKNVYGLTNAFERVKANNDRKAEKEKEKTTPKEQRDN